MSETTSYVIASFRLNDRRGLDNRLLYALDEHPASGRYTVQLDPIAGVEGPNASDLAIARVLFVLQGVIFAENFDPLIALQRAAEHAPKQVKCGGVRCRIVFRCVHHEWILSRKRPWKLLISRKKSGSTVTHIRIAFDHGQCQVLVQALRVDMFDFIAGVGHWRWYMLGYHIRESYTGQVDL
jgi:hypothetical protein